MKKNIIGIYQDEKSGKLRGIVNTLAEEGLTTVIITNKDIITDKLASIDLIFLPGGSQAVQYLNFKQRRTMTDFLAYGKGIFSTGWRRMIHRWRARSHQSRPRLCRGCRCC